MILLGIKIHLLGTDDAKRRRISSYGVGSVSYLVIRYRQCRKSQDGEPAMTRPWLFWDTPLLILGRSPFPLEKTMMVVESILLKNLQLTFDFLSEC